MTTPLGRLIAQKRAEADLTQVELADRLGTTDRQVKRWESGENGPGRYLPALVRELGISGEELADVIAAAPRSTRDRASEDAIAELLERVERLEAERGFRSR